MFAALVLICAGIWWSNPVFLGQANVMNTTRQIAMLGTFAIGIAFVIITGGIDLSVGSLVGLTGVIVAKVSSPAEGGLNLPIWIGISIALAVALLIGLVQGLLITQLGLQSFIVTLGGMLTLRGVSQALVQGATLGFGASPFRKLYRTGFFYDHGAALLSWPVVVFLVVIVIATYLLHFTVFGRYVFAIGGNRDAAEYSGIPVKRVETMTYVISAGLAGVAGISYASYIGEMSQNVGLAYELYAIAAAVLGGCSLRGGEGSVFGIVIGSSIMRVIDNGLNMFRVASSASASLLKRWVVEALSTIGLLRPAGGGDWRLNDNWQFIVIGSVILIAVIIDQVVHIVQGRRRTRRAGVMARQAEVAAAAPPS